MIILSIFTILVGIAYGAFLYLSKKHSLKKNKPLHDFILTLMRYAALFFIIFHIITNLESNSILLLILFVSSYLSTVAILVAHNT